MDHDNKLSGREHSKNHDNKYLDLDIEFEEKVYI